MKDETFKKISVAADIAWNLSIGLFTLTITGLAAKKIVGNVKKLRE